MPVSIRKSFNKPALHVLLIALLGLMAYSNTFDVPFHFDDEPNIVENPLIKTLHGFLNPSPEGVHPIVYKFFKIRVAGYFTFALNYQAHGLDVRGFHITNLAIHVLNGLLVYWLVLLTFRTPFMEGSPLKERAWLIALFSALLFVSHPVQTQAVTYIVQRLASLATLFYILSIVCYARWRLGKVKSQKSKVKKSHNFDLSSLIFYFLSLLSAVLAMKTKEIAFTLPLVIALYEVLFFTGKARTRLLRLMPLLLTMLIIPLTYVGLYSDMDKPFEEIMADVDVATTIQKTSRVDYLFTQFRVIVTYIRLLFIPINQNLDYDYPVYHSFFEPQVFLSFLFLLGIFGLGVFLFHRSRITDPALRVVAFGVFWFFIALSVESGIIPIVDVIFEHRVYLPSAGAFIAFVTAVFIVANKLKQRWRGAEKAAMGALLVAVIVLMGAAYARNLVWQDEVSLWADVVKKSPEKARGHNNLGLAYLHKGLTDKSLESFLVAVKLNPDFADAHNNLGIAYIYKGMPDKGIEHCRRAIELMSDFPKAYNNLGLAYYSKGMARQAIGHYRAAIKQKPDYAEAYHNLGNVYIKTAQYDDAIEIFRKTLEIDPYIAGTYHSLGYAHYMKGDIEEAIKHYKTALELQPGKKNTHYALGLAYQKKGLMDKAREHFRIAGAQ